MTNRFKNVAILFILIFCLNRPISYLNSFNNKFEQEATSDYDFDEFYIDDIDIETYEPENDTKAPNDLLITLRAALKQIKSPIWKHTKPPKGRDLLYLLPHKFTAIKYGRLDLNLLYNYTPKMNVTFNDLINIDQSVIDVINVLLRDKDITSEQLSQIIPLFTKAVIQERKLGGLLQAGFIYKYFNIQMHTSFQASERNFWISRKDQKIISEMFEGEDQTFDKKELYKIRYGIGDTRIKAGLNSLNTGSIQFDVGFEAIVPTARKQKLPYVDNSFVPTTEEALKNWMLDNVMAIRDHLITPQLGNNGHFGLGFFVESKLELFHKSLQLWNRFSIDNIFEADEDRLFLFKKSIDANSLTADPEELSRFMRENVFPPPFKARIKPGNIVNFVTNIAFNINKRWIFGIGYDLYIQDGEDIKKILDTEISANVLRIEDAQTPRTIQHKIFTETNFSFKKHNWDFILGVGADATFRSENIGQDWTFYLRLGAGF